MPMAPAPAGDQPQQPDQAGGGVAEAITDLDKRLGAIASAVAQAPGIPDELKSAVAGAFDGARQAIGQLVDFAAGGGEGGGEQAPPPGPPRGGVVSPEQGGGKASPVSMGRA